MASPYDSTAGAAPQQPPASEPKIVLDQQKATFLAAGLGLLGIAAVIGVWKLGISIVEHSIWTAILLYVVAICWEYNTTGVAKDGLDKGEAIGVLFVPLHFVVKAFKLRKAADQLSATQRQQSSDKTLLDEKSATYLGYALWVIGGLTLIGAIGLSLDIVGLVLGFLACTYLAGLAAAYVLLDVRKGGLDTSEVALVLWWPGLFGKSIDEMRLMVNTTLPNQRPASS